MDASRSLPIPKLAPFLLNRAVHSARQLVQTYRDDADQPHDEARLKKLLAAEMRKSFVTGFVTSLGGVLTLPLLLPGGLVASWLLQARLSACVAELRGYATDDPWVRARVLATLGGAQAPELLRQAGLGAAQWATRQASKSGGESAIKMVGEQLAPRLLRRVGGRGLRRWVPVVGAAVGGSVDLIATRRVAHAALRLFTQRKQLDAPAAPADDASDV